MASAMLGSLVKRQSGVTGALPYDPVEYTIMAACTAIAWAFTVELDIVAFFTFRPHRGLYFWSLVISSWGCALHALGFILKFLVGASWILDIPFISIGWCMMVTGQAFVLYSRLYLVIGTTRILHAIFAMIIINAIWLHIPTMILQWGSNDPKASINTRFSPSYNIMERIQLVVFSLQEFLISGVYIVATAKLLRSEYQDRGRRALTELIIINVICIAMDTVLIGLEFSNSYVGETSVKPLIYAIKLRLEFIVYKQLIAFAGPGFMPQTTNATNVSQAGTIPGKASGAYEMHSRNDNKMPPDAEHIYPDMKAGKVPPDPDHLYPDLAHNTDQVDFASTVDWKNGTGAAVSSPSQGAWSGSDASTPTAVVDKQLGLVVGKTEGVGPGGEILPPAPTLKSRARKADH